MKHFIKILLIALALGAVTAAVVIFTKTRNVHDKSDLAWVKLQFNLDREQLDKIQKLHNAYEQQCSQMCSDIEKANSTLQDLISKNNQVTPEIEAAIKECSRVQTECHTSMLNYFYSVSREMKPDDAKVYMQEMSKCVVQPGSHPQIR